MLKTAQMSVFDLRRHNQEKMLTNIVYTYHQADQRGKNCAEKAEMIVFGEVNVQLDCKPKNQQRGWKTNKRMKPDIN